MNKSNIPTAAEANRLLARFFDGQTSLQEEKLLYDYFRQVNLPEQHEELRPLFSYFEEGIQEEALCKENPPFAPIQPERALKSPLRRTALKWVAVVAVVALGATALLIPFSQTDNISEKGYTAAARHPADTSLKEESEATLPIEGVYMENGQVVTDHRKASQHIAQARREAQDLVGRYDKSHSTDIADELSEGIDDPEVLAAIQSACQ